MSGFRPDPIERKFRRKLNARHRQWAKGYIDGWRAAKSIMIDDLTHQIINDAFLQMTADTDTIERVIEIVEAQEN